MSQAGRRRGSPSAPGWPRGRTAVTAVLVAAMLTGCAAHRLALEQPLAPVTGVPQEFVLAQPAALRAVNAKTTELRAGTRWIQVGSIPQGAVFRTRDQVTTVNSFDVDEACIVVSGEQVIGYYLPVRHAFVAAEPVFIQKR